MLLNVPGAKSSLGLPGTVTRPALLGCLNWRPDVLQCSAYRCSGFIDRALEQLVTCDGKACLYVGARDSQRREPALRRKLDAARLRAGIIEVDVPVRSATISVRVQIPHSRVGRLGCSDLHERHTRRMRDIDFARIVMPKQERNRVSIALSTVTCPSSKCVLGDTAWRDTHRYHHFQLAHRVLVYRSGHTCRVENTR